MNKQTLTSHLPRTSRRNFKHYQGPWVLVPRLLNYASQIKERGACLFRGRGHNYTSDKIHVLWETYVFVNVDSIPVKCMHPYNGQQLDNYSQ